MQNVFPIILLVIQTCASGMYFYTGDWRRGCYWAAADVITFVVTF